MIKFDKCKTCNRIMRHYDAIVGFRRAVVGRMWGCGCGDPDEFILQDERIEI